MPKVWAAAGGSTGLERLQQLAAGGLETAASVVAPAQPWPATCSSSFASPGTPCARASAIRS